MLNSDWNSFVVKQYKQLKAKSDKHRTRAEQIRLIQEEVEEELPTEDLDLQDIFADSNICSNKSNIRMLATNQAIQEVVQYLVSLSIFQRIFHMSTCAMKNATENWVAFKG